MKVEGVQAREGKVEWREGQVSTGSRCGTSGRRSLIRTRAARGLLASPGVAPLLRHHPYSPHPHCVRRGAVVCLIAIPNQRFSSAGIPPRSGLLSYERKPRRGQRFAHLPGGHFSGIVQAHGRAAWPLFFEVDFTIGGDVRENDERGAEGVDVAKVNQVESELDSFVTKRDKQRQETGGERAGEELWHESVRVYRERREAESRKAWAAYHCSAAERTERTAAVIAAEHRARAEMLVPNGREETA